ncbi:MAG: hypothetical protein OXC19_18655 [Bryobacterales bacterium]|nr:hypothetical protein [Bryobacterales bacterium]
MKEKPPDPPVVDLIAPSYQPNAKELREDLRINATMEELGKAVTRTVKVRYVKPRKRR